MKKITMMCLLASLSVAQARLWTSADGTKTFNGDLKTYDPDSGKVTVMMKGRETVFAQDKLSADDLAFLKKWKEEADQPPVDELLATQKVGKALNAKVLTRLKGKKFKKASMEKAPEYYLLYFSASW